MKRKQHPNSLKNSQFIPGHKIRNTGKTRFKKGRTPWNKGKKVDTVGSNNPNWRGGKSVFVCVECGLKFKDYEQRERVCCTRQCHLNRIGREHSGENNNMWQGGITPLNFAIRSASFMKRWRIAVLERDDYTCQGCGERGGKLHVNHIKAFSRILKEQSIDSVEKAKGCKELNDISNGEVLCYECHKKTPNYKSLAKINTYHLLMKARDNPRDDFELDIEARNMDEAVRKAQSHPSLQGIPKYIIRKSIHRD